MDSLDKRTHRLLRSAISRAQQAFKCGHMNLEARAGESILKAGNLVGIRSKDVLILAVDTNLNGFFFDAKDRILIAAEGMAATLDNKCKITGICKDATLAQKIRLASRMLGGRQSGASAETVTEAAMKELSKTIMAAIATIESHAVQRP